MRASPPVLPRGIRNNNPGNIRLSPTRWQGQRSFQFDPAFVEFVDPVMGIRALMRLLLTYHYRHGLDTVESLINRYAPPHENATDAYIHQVAQRLGVGRREKIALADAGKVELLARAITSHENGRPQRGYPPDWYAGDIYAQAWRRVAQ
jgi:hypothetical protein